MFRRISLRDLRDDSGYVSRGAMGAGAAAAVIAAVFLLILLVGWLGGYVKTDGGHVAVIRNGGPFDNNKVRQVIQPASSRTWTGMWSHTHEYPAQQRFYTISANATQSDSCNVDTVSVPSQDGVSLGIEGTIYFTLNTDPKQLEDFDNKYGTRKFSYTCNGSVVSAFPYQGDNGWSAFLASVVRPVIDNDLREQVGDFRCADLVSSCALVQNTSGLSLAKVAAAGANNGKNISQVQTAINTSLQQDLTQTLGGDFLTNISFRLARVSLPTNVQSAVDSAQAAFAQITEAQAKVAQAKAQAQANRQKERGYKQCPACAAIDELGAIPSNVTTFAPGSGFAITPGK